jgi:hypothetical protein
MMASSAQAGGAIIFRLTGAHGFSATDLSAACGPQQRALSKAVIGEQGLITAARYQQKAQRGSGSQIALFLES